MKNQREKKWLFILLPVVILLALFTTGGYLFVSNSSNQISSGSDEGKTVLSGDIDFIRIETEFRPLQIEIRGRVRAENRLEIFPEVQGKILSSGKPFREGIQFQQGEPVLRLDDEEARLQLYASRSGYQTLIASLMPDIKLDYPNEMEIFEEWFTSLHPERVLPEIPGFKNTRMKRFLTSRGVYDKFYQIRSAENRLEKFTVRAPFTGTISSSKAEPGQFVSPQVHLGTLVDPDSYILTATIQQSQLEYINSGDTIEVSNQNRRRSWTATIVRINPSLSPQTQTVEIYLKLAGNGIREGQLLEGIVEADDPQPVAEIPKSALLRNGYVYALRDGTVQQVPVRVVDIGHTTIRVTGLNDGEEIARDAAKALSGQIITREAP